MDIKTYESLRRYGTGTNGIEDWREKQSRFVRLIALLIIESDRLGFELTFGDAFAVDGHMHNSLHYKRLAFDLNLFKEGQYLTATAAHTELGLYWESLGGSWGGRFGDGNHYSLEHEGVR